MAFIHAYPAMRAVKLARMWQLSVFLAQQIKYFTITTVWMHVLPVTLTTKCTAWTVQKTVRRVMMRIRALTVKMTFS